MKNYPAPHLAGTTDLQEFVRRMVCEHPERSRLSEDGADVQVQFGDILRWKNSESGLFAEKVSLVLTPACDLVREGAERAVLLSGDLRPLEPKKWLYQANHAKTPIIEIPEEGRFWIDWNLKNVRALTPGEIKGLLSEPVMLKRIGRLREMYAIEIQQKFLSDFGRIGQPANPPATFAISLSIYFVDTEGKARPLATGELQNAVCYVGRDKQSKSVHRLVVSERACDAIEQAVGLLDEGRVHQSGRTSLVALKGDKDFFLRLERGMVEIPSENAGAKNEKNAANNIYSCIRRNSDWSDGGNIADANQKKAALLFDIRDIFDGEQPT